MCAGYSVKLISFLFISQSKFVSNFLSIFQNMCGHCHTKLCAGYSVKLKKKIVVKSYREKVTVNCFEHHTYIQQVYFSIITKYICNSASNQRKSLLFIMFSLLYKIKIRKMRKILFTLVTTLFTFVQTVTVNIIYFFIKFYDVFVFCKKGAKEAY